MTHPTITEQEVLDVLTSYKAKNITTISVKNITPMFDTLMVCTGTSTRHVKTVSEQLMQHFKPRLPQKPHAEGLEMGEWVLIDLHDIIVHVMLSKTRDFYRLEQLWQTAAQTEETTCMNDSD